VAVVLLPGLLATEAGGRKEFDLDVGTVGDALRALPVSGKHDRGSEVSHSVPCRHFS